MVISAWFHQRQINSSIWWGENHICLCIAAKEHSLKTQHIYIRTSVLRYLCIQLFQSADILVSERNIMARGFCKSRHRKIPQNIPQLVFNLENIQCHGCARLNTFEFKSTRLAFGGAVAGCTNACRYDVRATTTYHHIIIAPTHFL